MKHRLSRVFLDGRPVALRADDIAPTLARIVSVGGKQPETVEVHYLLSPRDRRGHVIGTTEILDRAAEPTRPIYLLSIPKGGANPTVKTRQAVLSGDPVISQLGKEPREHEPGVFRSPSQGLPFASPSGTSSAARNAAALAAAEAEAQERQEADRNHDDSLMEEQEARDEAYQDGDDTY